MKSNNGARLLSIALLALTVSQAVFTLSSCSASAREINEIAIVLAIGIEKNPDGPGYELTVQIAQPASMQYGSESSSEAAYLNLKETGIGVADTLAQVAESTSRYLFTKNNQLIVISEEVAAEGIAPIIDYFLRSEGGRLNEDLVLVRGSSPNELLSLSSLLERTPSLQVDKMHIFLENTETTLFEYVIATLSDNTNPTVAAMELFENADGTMDVRMFGAAVFEGNKLKCYIDQDDLDYSLYLRNRKSAGNITVEFNGDYYAFRLSDTEGDVNVEPTLDGKYKSTFVLRQQYTLVDTNTTADLLDYEYLSELEKSLFDHVTAKYEHLVASSRENGIDIIGIGDKIWRKYPRKSKEYMENWDEECANIDIEFDFDIRIFDIGIIHTTALPKSEYRKDTEK